MHQQLLRQAAAHADHLQEALRIQEQELERKHVLALEEKLLHQKGVFISETSGNMARLKGVIEYLKGKNPALLNVQDDLIAHVRTLKGDTAH